MSDRISLLDSASFLLSIVDTNLLGKRAIEIAVDDHETLAWIARSRAIVKAHWRKRDKREAKHRRK